MDKVELRTTTMGHGAGALAGHSRGSSGRVTRPTTKIGRATHVDTGDAWFNAKIGVSAAAAGAGAGAYSIEANAAMESGVALEPLGGIAARTGKAINLRVGAGSLLIQGQTRGETIQLWFNRATKTVETAYTVSR